VLVDGNLLPQCQIFGGQAEPGHQECPDQKVNRLDDAHEDVSQSCQDTGDSTPEKAGHQISQLRLTSPKIEAACSTPKA
jgi:hypothetical protein